MGGEGRNAVEPRQQKTSSDSYESRAGVFQMRCRRIAKLECQAGTTLLSRSAAAAALPRFAPLFLLFYFFSLLVSPSRFVMIGISSFVGRYRGVCPK
jgi:hypothetical protein